MEPQELHLCEDHAREYLSAADVGPELDPPPSVAGQIAAQLKVGQTSEELSRLDKQACPVCGITFYEFRSQGRLGCPHDYECFEAELEPLIVSIHGATEHTGKKPIRQLDLGVNPIDVIRMRREMQEAIEQENYEKASELRDEIRRIENALNA